MSSNVTFLSEYPSFQQMRRNELSLTFLPAVQNPNNAEAAYSSFRWTVARYTLFSDCCGSPCALNTRSTYRSRVHDAITLVMWSLADRRSLIVMPRTVICRTCSMSRHVRGNCCGLIALALDDWNVISLHFCAFNRKLFSSAHSCTCCTSCTLLWLLMAGMTEYVSSAYLTSSLPGCIDRRAAVLTT